MVHEAAKRDVVMETFQRQGCFNICSVASDKLLLTWPTLNVGFGLKDGSCLDDVTRPGCHDPRINDVQTGPEKRHETASHANSDVTCFADFLSHSQ